VSANAASNERRDHDAPAAGGALAWCEPCGQVVAEDEAATAPDGALRCPDCGGELVPTGDDDAAPKAPWHFKVLLVGTVGYLIYRLIWFILWLSHHA
jgi:hypothetical protein